MTVKYYTDEAGTKKIVLKEGRVSCSCCDVGECRFYPAIGIQQGFYTAADLPDEIYFNNFPSQYLFTKSGGEFYATIIGNDYRIIITYFDQPIWQPGDEDFNAAWRLEILQSGEWEWVSEIGQSGFLFGSEDLGTSSTYAETYAISGPVSATVTRVPKDFETASETCEWLGDGLRLRYNSRYVFRFDSPRYNTFEGNFKWQVNGNNKIGDQNTPVGEYEGGYTVS